MGVLRDILSFLWNTSLNLMTVFVSKSVEQARLIASLLEVEVNLAVELYLRIPIFNFVLSCIPALASKLDRIASRWGLTPIYDFYPEYHPRLDAIKNKIREYLQSPNTNQELIDTFRRVLLRMHNIQPDIFPRPTIDGIRQHFTDHWPHIRPLNKASCLIVKPTSIRICWGQTESEIAEPTLWINPYLVQALEAAEEVRTNVYSTLIIYQLMQLQNTDIEVYLKFLTIVTLLHEAMHHLVYLVSSGRTTPAGIGALDRDSGFQLEQELFGGRVFTEIRRVNIFKLTKVRGLGLSHHPPNPPKIIGE